MKIFQNTLTVRSGGGSKREKKWLKNGFINILYFRATHTEICMKKYSETTKLGRFVVTPDHVQIGGGSYYLYIFLLLYRNRDGQESDIF